MLSIEDDIPVVGLAEIQNDSLLSFSRASTDDDVSEADLSQNGSEQ